MLRQLFEVGARHGGGQADEIRYTVPSSAGNDLVVIRSVSKCCGFAKVQLAKTGPSSKLLWINSNINLFLGRRLRNVLSEIHAYHDWKEEWFKLYEHMLWEQNIKSTTREIKLAFAREQNLHLLAINPAEKSIHHIDNDVLLSYMDLGDRKKIAENMLQNVHLSLHLLKNLQKQVKEHNNHITQGTFFV